ncbi:MAG: hypothetical protein DRI23_11950, partial [Candidatus Cloacimonadota bacterium]
KIANQNPESLDYKNIPGCTYCSPEVASVGYTEQAAIDAGYELKIGKFPFTWKINKISFHWISMYIRAYIQQIFVIINFLMLQFVSKNFSFTFIFCVEM